MNTSPASPQILFYFKDNFMQGHRGNYLRTLTLLDYLQNAGIEFTVYSRYGMADEWDAASILNFKKRYPKAHLIVEKQGFYGRVVTRVRNALLLLFPQWALPICRFRAIGLNPAYTRLKNHQVTIVSYTDGVTELNGIELKKTLLETHDLCFLNYISRGFWASWTHRASSKYRKDCVVADHVFGLIAIQAFEAEFYRKVTKETQVACIPSYGHGPNFLSRSPMAYKYDLIFVGSQGSINSKGLCRFIKEHAKLLKPYQLVVCGRVCDEHQLRSSVRDLPNIHLAGLVDNLSPLYQQSRFAISPVEGTGLKMKIVEALKHSTPVIANHSSIHGLPRGYEDCVFPESKLEGLLHSSADTLRKIEQDAARYYKQFEAGSNKEHLLTLIRDCAVAQ